MSRLFLSSFVALLSSLHVVIVSIWWLLSACSVDAINSRIRHSADAQASLDLFEKYVYPLFDERKCASCHREDGMAKGHAFAAKKITTAHKAALRYVDFSDIENSGLVINSKDPKHKHSCDKASGECDENADKLIAALTKWQKSRNSNVEELLRYTEEKDADQGKTGDYTNHKLKFSLNSLVEGGVGNVTLEITASKSTTTNLLTISDFKLTTTDKHIFLGGLRAKHNGKNSSDETKMRVCALVKPSDNEVLTQFYGITFVLEDANSSPNNIAIGLKDLRVAKDNDKCENRKSGLSKARTEFNNKTSGIGKVIQDSCVSNCHVNNTQRVDLAVFDNLYSKRQAIIERVSCGEGINCMPPDPNVLGSSNKKWLLDWMNNLPDEP